MRQQEKVAHISCPSSSIVSCTHPSYSSIQPVTPTAAHRYSHAPSGASNLAVHAQYTSPCSKEAMTSHNSTCKHPPPTHPPLMRRYLAPSADLALLEKYHRTNSTLPARRMLFWLLSGVSGLPFQHQLQRLYMYPTDYCTETDSAPRSWRKMRVL